MHLTITMHDKLWSFWIKFLKNHLASVEEILYCNATSWTPTQYTLGDQSSTHYLNDLLTYSSLLLPQRPTYSSLIHITWATYSLTHLSLLLPERPTYSSLQCVNVPLNHLNQYAVIPQPLPPTLATVFSKALLHDLSCTSSVHHQAFLKVLLFHYYQLYKQIMFNYNVLFIIMYMWILLLLRL